VKSVDDGVELPVRAVEQGRLVLGQGRSSSLCDSDGTRTRKRSTFKFRLGDSQSPARVVPSLISELLFRIISSLASSSVPVPDILEAISA